jgi:alpha-1,2-mannosyltransferase
VLRSIGIVGAGLGLALGLQTLVFHATTDPLIDLRVYYDAGMRLNQGQPLYDPAATASTGLYLNPPLLAILFRPLALLPFPVVAVLWQCLLLGAIALTIWRAGLRIEVALAACWLGLPIMWAVAIGQVEPIITLLIALGSPLTLALAANIKVFPILVAVYWIARRDTKALMRLAIGGIVLIGFQFVVEPAATLAWFQLTWLRPAFAVRSISPFAISPVLWLALVLVLVIVAFRFGRTRHGWALAVTLAVLAYPRLLAYQLMTLLAGVSGPEPTSTVRDRNTSTSPAAE